ncbi:glycosyltransferase family 2 protein [Luteimonas saliphila]|uniref:glycosyltransferase family 2 protein n=1 Tax=Luteimonas saliphila TaxID=2804919 RepID=UPI001EE23FF6|nr:glycosyltransferase family 2 protein [Luteimonas saliphila]
MGLVAGTAEGIVAIAQGHYRLRLAPPAGDVVIEPIGRTAALRAMWRAASAPADDARGPRWPTGVLRLMSGLRRGPRGLTNALVEAYRRRLFLRGHALLGRATASYRPAPWPALSEDALLVPPVRDAGRLADVPRHGDDAGGGLMLQRALPWLPIEAGWYLLRLSCRGVDGDPQPLLLQPDHGHGPVPDRGVFLSADAQAEGGQLLVMFDSPALSLWLRTAWRHAELAVESMQLIRIGRLRALWEMLRGSVPGTGTLPGETLRFLRESRTAGLSAAADALLRRYNRLHDIGPEPYAAWTLCFDTLRGSDLAQLRLRAAAFGQGPEFSVLVPVYNTPEPWLRRCIDSVLAQVYPRWQLCIADDASSDPAVSRVLEEYAAKDPRIRVVRRESNGHIARASNTALEMATGAYVALLDHDDELRPHALLEMAQAIVDDPTLDLLYSDEDKIDGEGRRFDPYFKPDWNPDLLRSQNYVCHLSVIRTSLVRAVGGFRPGFEGSQDHDLVLRCSERVEPSRIRHIPKVLYHWRAIEGSTALSRDAKDYAAAAGVRAVDEHLARCYPGARAEELSHGHYRVRWPLPTPAPRVSLLVPTRDRACLLRTCVESVFERTDYPDFEVVVIDNQSSEPDALAYLDELRLRARVRVLRFDAPFNYSAINNRAAGQCDGEILGLVNNDIEVVSPDWLREMVSHAVRPEVGAVGAMLYYPDDTIQHAGVVLGIHGVAAHVYCGMPRGYPGHGGRVRVAQQLSAVTGACLMVRRSVFEEVGGLDESLRVAFNDIDFCLRVRAAGYRNLWTPFAELYHHESASRGSEDTEEKRARFVGEVEAMLQRWGPQLLSDPAYNQNLSLSSLNSEYAFPPRG